MNASCTADARFLGIDIGTTTLSFAVVSRAETRVIHTLTIPNDSALPLPGTQDAVRIADLTLGTVFSLISQYPGVCAIGVTGQMHGVVCLDNGGAPVSPLYTWQYPLADEGLCHRIREKTGMRVHPGYGHATLYALARQGGIPPQAAQYCTIMDYIVMRLTGRSAPMIHATNAASLGLYDLARGSFDQAALRALELPLRAPQTTALECICGHHRGIPVCAAIGDNQASFYGSVRDEAHSVLVNYGTGSQLSLITDSPIAPPGCEIRPYPGGKYLLCKSALCGGRAYAMLERFFADYMRAAGSKAASQYGTMNQLALEAYRDRIRLSVNTQFCGTREEPSLRGSVLNIGDDNFTPGAMILGVLQGMVDELADAFDPTAHPGMRTLVASGNAVQKNPVLRMLLRDAFSLPLSLPTQREEAAFGAALCAAVSAKIASPAEAKALITYTGG